MRRAVLSLVSTFAFVAPVMAQVAADAPQPVDQAVADLDPLAVSQRRVEPGIAQFHGGTALWRLPAGVYIPGISGGGGREQTYVYQEPGVRAFIRRPEYLVWNPQASGTYDGLTMNAAPAVDGAFRPMVAPDTVFDLTYRHNLLGPKPEDDPNWVDRRLDTRLRPIELQPIDRSLGSWRHQTGNMDLGPEAAVNGVTQVRRIGEPLKLRELPREAVFPGEPARASSTDAEVKPGDPAE